MPKIKISPSAILLLIGILTSKNRPLSAAVFICASIHELGHIVAAALLKIKIKCFELSVCGAKIIPSNTICTYTDEIILCLSGPLANFITLCILVPLVNIGADSLIESLDFLTYIALFSGMLGLVNLLPIKSLDGGRILFCSLSGMLGVRAGDVGLKICTFVFALILWMLSVYLLILSRGGIVFFTFSLCMLLKIFDK